MTSGFVSFIMHDKRKNFEIVFSLFWMEISSFYNLLCIFLNIFTLQQYEIILRCLQFLHFNNNGNYGKDLADKVFKVFSSPHPSGGLWCCPL